MYSILIELYKMFHVFGMYLFLFMLIMFGMGVVYLNILKD